MSGTAETARTRTAEGVSPGSNPAVSGHSARHDASYVVVVTRARVPRAQLR